MVVALCGVRLLYHTHLCTCGVEKLLECLPIQTQDGRSVAVFLVSLEDLDIGYSLHNTFSTGREHSLCFMLYNVF